FFRRVAVVGSNRGVIGTRNGGRDQRGLARHVRGVGGKSDGERAGEVVVRRVGEGAVSVQRYGPVGGRVDELCGQRIAVGVLVVLEYTGGGNAQRRVFFRGVAVVGSNRDALSNRFTSKQ